MELKELYDKYDILGPRYTSYPAHPHWKGAPNQQEWLAEVGEYARMGKDFDLYVHIPFCESLCTYCGCSRVITRNQDLASDYVTALLKEWEIYQKSSPGLKLKSIHLGGGTPTFLNLENLKRLLDGLLPEKKSEMVLGAIEIDPRVTSFEQIDLLVEKGFTKFSLGIQDFDPHVQKVINRIQPIELVKKVTDYLNLKKINSVNYDLIFGLPEQTVETITNTINEVVKLKPGTIAFYSYAHVPWKIPSQKLLEKYHIPAGQEKRELYHIGKKLLEESGYMEIGLDHFALSTDPLHVSYLEGRLKRNFMGYTSIKGHATIGLGATSISNSERYYVQNEKNPKQYIESIYEEVIPFVTGHHLTEVEMAISDAIQEIMCQGKTCLTKILANLDDEEKNQLKNQYSQMEKDGLLTLEGSSLSVTESGKQFLRNICMVMDHHLAEKVSNQFSKTI